MARGEMTGRSAGMAAAALLLLASIALGGAAAVQISDRSFADRIHSSVRETMDVGNGTFSFSSFNSSSEEHFVCNGDASYNLDHGVLWLANGTSNAGSVFYIEWMPLVDGFTSTFNVSLFSFTSGTGDEAPEGFTFLLNGASYQALGGDAAGLGYASAFVNGTDGIDAGVAIEFDFHTDAQMNDPAYAHVSAHARYNSSLPNSANELYSLGMAELPYQATAGLAQTHVVDVEYTAANQTLFVAVDGMNVLTIPGLGLGTILNSNNGFVGFTASNGANNAGAYWVNSWSFALYQETTSSSIDSDDGDGGDGGTTDDGPTPLGIFAVCGGIFLCFALCCLVAITIFISSEDLRRTLSKALNRNKAPQPYVPVSQEDDYTSALGIN